MTGRTRIPKTELTGPTGRLIRIATRKLLGAVPEPAEVMWHSPRVVKHASAFGRKTRKWTAVDPNLRSFADMAVASLVGCTWCLDLGYFLTRNEGLDEAKAREVPRWRESDVFTPLERRVMEYAEAMCRTPTAVTDELSADLLARLGPKAMVELTASIAFANMSARMNTAMGIEAQGFAAACGLRPIARPTAVAATSARAAA